VKTLVLLSQKGGAGKSTLALHIAVCAERQGLRTLLVDVDPQGSIAGWAERRGERTPDVLPTHPAKLAAVCADSAREGYDLIVIDTAPAADRGAMVAAGVADFILIPCRPAQFDLDAVVTTVAMIRTVRKPFAIAFNAAPPRGRQIEDATSLVVASEYPYLAHSIRSRVAFQSCLTSGDTAMELEPSSIAAREMGDFYGELMGRMDRLDRLVTAVPNGDNTKTKRSA
jgi:chromosome partitioning protein